MSTTKIARSRTLPKITRKLGWNTSKHDPWITGRVHSFVSRHPKRWWDWGHPLMIFTGTPFGGSYDNPKPPTWWYKPVPRKPMWRTGYPRYRLQVITDYKAFRAATEGLNEDQMYEWKAIASNQDGEITLGHRYWGGQFYGLDRLEMALVGKYLRRWRRYNWFGLRSWLYSQALHAAVHQRKPFTCQAVPPPRSGGYSHWYCDRKRNHDGLHRFGLTVWGDVGGEPIGCTHDPDRVLVKAED